MLLSLQKMCVPVSGAASLSCYVFRQSHQISLGYVIGVIQRDICSSDYFFLIYGQSEEVQFSRYRRPFLLALCRTEALSKDL